MQIHFHSPEQQSKLIAMMQAVLSNIAGIVFSDPKEDEKMIRYHASQTGQLELLKQLYEDNYPDPNPKLEGEQP